MPINFFPLKWPLKVKYITSICPIYYLHVSATICSNSPATLHCRLNGGNKLAHLTCMTDYNIKVLHSATFAMTHSFRISYVLLASSRKRPDLSVCSLSEGAPRWNNNPRKRFSICSSGCYMTMNNVGTYRNEESATKRTPYHLRICVNCAAQKQTHMTYVDF